MRTFMDIAGDDSTEDKMKSQGLSFDPSYFKAKKEVFVQQKMQTSWADPEGGQGSVPPPPPLKNQKSIGFLCTTGPDPLKNHKATKPAFNVGPSSARQQNAI